MRTKPRIGLFAGTFDPVHTGHLVFAIKAVKAAKLDAVYFLPERRPRQKPDAVHFGHRTAMLTRAIRPYPCFGLLELPDVYFDVKRTLPKLQKQFNGADLVFLMGSDTFLKMNSDSWDQRDLRNFLAQVGIVIGLRKEQTRPQLKTVIDNLPFKPVTLEVLDLPTKHFSSSRIRHNFRRGQTADGLLTSVQVYARSQWLYISLAGE